MNTLDRIRFGEPLTQEDLEEASATELLVLLLRENISDSMEQLQSEIEKLKPV